MRTTEPYEGLRFPWPYQRIKYICLALSASRPSYLTRHDNDSCLWLFFAIVHSTSLVLHSIDLLTCAPFLYFRLNFLRSSTFSFRYLLTFLLHHLPSSYGIEHLLNNLLYSCIFCLYY